MGKKGSRDLDGRKIPSDPEAEKALIASILLDPEEAKASCLEILNPHHFSHPGFRDLIPILQRKVKRGDALDVSLLLTELPPTLSPEYFLSTMERTVPSGARLEEYYQRVVDVSKKRQYWWAAVKLLDEAEAPRISAEDLRKTLTCEVEKIENSVEMPEVKSLAAVLPRALQAVQPASERRFSGALQTGLYALDEIMMGGLHPGWLTILAARPSMGKSTLALNIAANLAEKGHPTLFFSLETHAEMLVTSMLARRTHSDSYHLLRGTYSPEVKRKIQAEAEAARSLPLYFSDQAKLTTGLLRQISRQCVTRYGIEAVVVDYLQLMEPDDREAGRTVQVSQMSRGVKLLAQELQVPVLLLSQLNRGVEMRDDKIPRLMDLRESGSIEQDADAVLFLYRESYYRPSAPKDVATVKIAKQRHGPIGTRALRYNAKENSFWSTEESL